MVSGLKQTVTGDTVVETEKIASEAFQAYADVLKDDSRKILREEKELGISSEVR